MGRAQIPLVSHGEAPPPYPYQGQDNYAWWKPNYWGWKQWAIAAISFIVILIAIVVGAVLGVRANQYPNYSKLTYSIKDTYSGTTFFDKFDYFYGYDPAEGFVHYTDREAAKSLNLTYASSSSAILRVDQSDLNATTGRKSARIYSKNTYNNGLFIFDILNSPYGCSTWPALWLSDTNNWPAHGEIVSQLCARETCMTR